MMRATGTATRPALRTSTLVALTALAMVAAPRGGRAYEDFTVDFSDAALPFFLEQPAGAATVTLDNGRVAFPEGEGAFVRTVDRDFADVDFAVEVSVAIPRAGANAYLGLGMEREAPTIYCLYQGRTDDLPVYSSVKNHQFTQDGVSKGVLGTHRLRLEWNAGTQTAACKLQTSYIPGGTFNPNFTLQPVDGSDLAYTTENASVFFGGNGVTFDDLEITGTEVGVE